MARIDELTNCPECNSSWDGGDIFETLRPQKWCENMSDDELREDVHKHYAPPHRFSRLVGVEVRGGYDGVSFWECPDCKARWDRFTQRKVVNAHASSGSAVE
jgi:hypothetical protein